MGDTTNALLLLERAYEERDDELTWIGIDSWEPAVRTQPRFTALLRRMRLDSVPRPSPEAAAGH